MRNQNERRGINGLTSATAAVGLGVISSVASAQHAGDVLLEVIDGRIVTGLLGGESNPIVVHDQRAFGSEFGEILPNFTDEPGFDSEPGTFDPASSIGFNVLEGLKSWNGSAWVDAGAVTLEIAYATESVTVGSDPVAGFAMPVSPNGEWHRHFDFTLNAPAADGLYLLTWELHSTDPSVGASRPFYIVFNQNGDEAQHAAAIEWVATNLVPGMKFRDPELNAGANNTLTVTNCVAGGSITFAYSFRFGSARVPGCPGLEVWIDSPTVITNRRADSSGVAELSIFIPTGAIGRTVFVQAADRENCLVSNLLERTF